MRWDTRPVVATRRLEDFTTARAYAILDMYLGACARGLQFAFPKEKPLNYLTCTSQSVQEQP